MAGQQSARPREKDSNLGQVFIRDLKQTRLQRDYLRELRDLYHFYLDDERRSKLDQMGRVRRAFSLLVWTGKSLLLKLSPPRRLALLISLLLLFLGWTEIGVVQNRLITTDLHPWGFLILLMVLMLELKDKLLARDEIEIARQVQLALLPNEHAEIPGWSVWSYSRPANDVGGDLVDYIELDGFRHGVLLGDVAGKGLGAALLTAKLQATLRALVPDAVSLDDLAARVNDIFFRDGLDNRFATLFYGELEHDSGQLRYVNAGHNPPFLIRRDSIDRLDPSWMPLGMFATSNYTEYADQLETGDILLIYSDGLTEATNSADEEFGMERLEAMLPDFRTLQPHEIGTYILKAVDRFLGDARLTDDLSMVIIVKE
jgi:sigma-B regulation protein RsbU (phosphoserine phosphatase)